MKLTEDDIVNLESVANTLRGMTMDPSIPAHAVRVMRTLAAEIDGITDRYDEGDDGLDPDRLREDRDERRRLDAEDTP